MKVETEKEIRTITKSLEDTVLTEDEIMLEYQKFSSVDLSNSNGDADDELKELLWLSRIESINRQKIRQLAKAQFTSEEKDIYLLRIKKVIDDYEDNHFTQEEKNYLGEQMMNLLWKCVSECSPSSSAPYTKEDVIDACFEGMAKAMNRFKKNNDKYTFSAYMYAAMRNTVIDMVRREQKRAQRLEETSLDVYHRDCIEKDVIAEPRMNIEEVVQRREMLSEIKKKLSSEEIFILKHYMLDNANRMTQVELAECFDIKVYEMKEKIKRLTKKVKEILLEIGISPEY